MQFDVEIAPRTTAHERAGLALVAVMMVVMLVALVAV
jgi:Tfp pilus assembly protein PilX